MDYELMRKRIIRRRDRGESIRGIARAERVSRNYVRRIVRNRHKTFLPCNRRKSKLDPYREKITYLVFEKELSGVRILEELKEIGYDGGKSILNEYIAQIRPKGRRKATIELEVSEGEEGQMDWSEYTLYLGDQELVVYAFSYILSYSRMMFLRFATDMTLPTLISLHRECFSELKGTARTNTYDNMTTVGRHIGPGKVEINKRFEAFSKHYGFQIRLLPPGRPDLHGKVEKGFSYIKKNFLAGRQFESIDDLNRKAQWWCDTKANVRVHGSLRERPIDRYQQELPFLVPVPHDEFDNIIQIVTRKVSPYFRISLDTNHYSVHPDHVGRNATIKVYDEYIKIFIDHKLAAVHPLLDGRYQKSILPEHEIAFQSAGHRHELLKETFLRLGPAAEAFYQGLVQERGKGAGYHLSRILKLSKRHGSPVVAGALRHAYRFGAFNADAVVRIVHGKALTKAQHQRKPDMGEPILPSENVRKWLESHDVEKKDLSDYDKITSAFTDQEE